MGPGFEILRFVDAASSILYVLLAQETGALGRRVRMAHERGNGIADGDEGFEVRSKQHGHEGNDYSQVQYGLYPQCFVADLNTAGLCLHSERSIIAVGAMGNVYHPIISKCSSQYESRERYARSVTHITWTDIAISRSTLARMGRMPTIFEKLRMEGMPISRYRLVVCASVTSSLVGLDRT